MSSFGLRLIHILPTLLILSGMLVGLPLLGVWAAGHRLAPYFELPPQTVPVPQASFSGAVFALLVVLIAAALALPVRRAVRALRAVGPAENGRRYPFPGWGWVGLGGGALAWVLAWSRFAFMAALQPHTFTPLWLAYIVVVNALCVQRTGRSLLTHERRYFACLFPASALFWWFFEYLNRFVHNWYYVGANFGPWSYFAFATLPFATVLPAVMSTQRLVLSFDWMRRAFANCWPLPGCRARWLPRAALVAAGAGLAGIGLWPSALFPLLWVSPLVIICSVRSLRGEPHALQPLCGADWSTPAAAALAALICGFFWEMWNAFSLAKWQYSIPFAQRFEIFEMPLLGYAGYLPFGLECTAVAGLVEELVAGRKELPAHA